LFSCGQERLVFIFYRLLKLIREKKSADINALADIYYQSRIATFDWMNPNEIKLDDFHRDTKGEKIWVAESKGHVVGFVSFWEVEGFIHNLFVLPDYVSQGIGSQLLTTCLSHMSRPATLKCVSANTRALSFYKQKGWKTIDYGTSEGVEYQIMQFINDK
jgi:GNAT superfamily N-acetyltransferase